MRINSKNAISHFFPNPCYEQVYFEAVANAIYAGATEISILTKIHSFDQASTLSVTITDNGEGFRVSLLEDEFKELFSHGQMFYKSQSIIVDSEEEKFPVDLYVMTYDTFIKDAESRNSTFLRILKDSIQKAVTDSGNGQAATTEEK